MQIESLDDWREYADILHRMGYDIFQLQFDIKSPEGFHARFILAGCPDVEFVTRNEAVHDAILKYGYKKRS
ncbi:MAG: hypothetical protein CVU91_07345 [Firmicutes bacterium HGW-Firmicutes-16]|nr:MAG: hypothetical protein CVU91_07345 [Firmicutes bacterium HGW-Firmicutes-16]